jgi:uncharacterized membrane protein
MTINPYQPPATEEIQLLGTSAVGGTLQGGIEGNYDFSVIDVLLEAWQKTDGIKGTFFSAVLVSFVIVVGIGLIFSMANGAILEAGVREGMSPSMIEIIGSIMAFLQHIFKVIVSLPMLVGITMIGVYRSVDVPIRFSIVFDYFEYTIPIVIATILTIILVAIGSLLLIIPGIYLFIAYLLTQPLIVEKNLTSWQAMEASRKAITHHWFKVFFIYLIMAIIYIISIIPLGLGLIWTAPMKVNMRGILYRIMFGVEEARSGVVAR